MRDNTFRVVAKNEATTIWLYDEIGPWGVTGKMFVDELSAIGADTPVTVRINSPGGDAFDGMAIYSNLIRRKNVTAEVDGVAASAAAFIAMAASKVIMAENAVMMAHNAWTLAAGNADDLRKQIDMLDKFDQQQVKIFTGRTGLAVDRVQELMRNETYMTAEEAVGLGFADEVFAEHRLAASDMRREFTREVKPRSDVGTFHNTDTTAIVEDSIWRRQNAALRARIAGAELNVRRDERGKPIPTDDGTGLQVERA